jgi:hypothetical protein
MKFQSLNMKVYIFAWTMEPTCDLETSWMQQKTFRKTDLQYWEMADWMTCTQLFDAQNSRMFWRCFHVSKKLTAWWCPKRDCKTWSRSTLEIVSIRWQPLNKHKLQSHPISISLWYTLMSTQILSMVLNMFLQIVKTTHSESLETWRLSFSISQFIFHNPC